MADKEFHILNKPVAPARYEALVQDIKQQLIAERLYHLGLFFVSAYEQDRFSTETDGLIQQKLQWRNE